MFSTDWGSFSCTHKQLSLEKISKGFRAYTAQIEWYKAGICFKLAQTYTACRFVVIQNLPLGKTCV